MWGVVAKTFGGLAALSAGFYLKYWYITGIDNGNTPFVLIPSFALVGLGVFLLIKAAKAEEAPPKYAEEGLVAGEGMENSLTRNNQMMAEYAKTSQARDRLKILEISAAAEEGKK